MSRNIGNNKTRSAKGVRAERTRARILDTAEALFSKHGFFGVTLKQIAGGAKVDTALVHYYFGDRKGVFDEVIHRRSEQFNFGRREALDEYVRKANGHVTTEGILDAFITPMLDLAQNGGPGWRNYFALLGQATNVPGWGMKIVTKHFDPAVGHLVEILRASMPGCDQKSLYRSVMMLAGGLAQTLANTGRIDRLSDGLCRSSDFESARRHMIPFLAAGFERVCVQRPVRKRAPRRQQ